MDILCWLLTVYWIVLLIWVISSWLAMMAGELGAVARRANRLTSPLVDPLVRPLRNMLPPVRLGSVGLDLSPILLFVIVGVLLSICRGR
jgi:YggT family protein